ncbi:carbohydrate sulfotransferase 10-like isoform X2 [Penaeus chinensis]|uniref:carbohydrate sulfotransferase 10-like isoform X2 n=1 Tax=Penaeus chinensis TaxID=139456 RepID=UPI001FB68897|nr:carbohydrate sulfotransferase 10-like isoform X2 [Penaeus chinensis]
MIISIPKMKNTLHFLKLTVLFLLLSLVVYYVIYKSHRPKVYKNEIFYADTVKEDSYVVHQTKRSKFDNDFAVEKTFKFTLSGETISHTLKENVTKISGGVFSKLKSTSVIINDTKRINITQYQPLESLLDENTSDKLKTNDRHLQPHITEAISSHKLVESKKTVIFSGVTDKDSRSVIMLDDTAKRLEHRAEVVRRLCQKWNTEKGKPLHRVSEKKEQIILSHFYLARSASTLTCPINKAGSTSIVAGLMEAEGNSLPTMEDDSLSVHGAAAVLRPQTEAEFNFTKKYFFKFLLVRHPFERLLSAYRDKVERANHWSLVQFRKHILSSLSSKQIEIGTESTTSEEENDAAREANEPNEEIPSFSDFLEYILMPNMTDADFSSHWAPYWQWCSPCALNYTAIATLETAGSDLEYIWRRVGLRSSEKPWRNRNGLSLSPKPSVLSRYYQQLSPSLIRRVYQEYSRDFKLFQYDVRDVFRLGRHCVLGDCSDVGYL